MNEMLRSLGFGQVNANKWTNGEAMMINVRPSDLRLYCNGDINDLITLDYVIDHADPETMKRHVEKFMSMVGKCIQVDEE